ncbi:iron uptake transporter permease EfeU [Vibrio palustris]|uniref:Ferrous iron permease EfeU n=1 Tax=Vibrio palustris TaxID=1918946 RepID=A0A1R4B698_9VIBR|nr:iron uptake transporter permease EfeU [Vibrio palustris]SJL84439.1 Ferrous iron permease EfeU [Vibrio palustris]
MFFVPFLIMLREGLEAALIVVLIASYLKKTGQSQWMNAVWIGAFSAVALCLGLGFFIEATTGEFPQQQQELFEGIVAAIAVVMLTYMVFWMQNASKNIGKDLQTAIDGAISQQDGKAKALVIMVFLAVAREGLESVFFLIAAFSQDVGVMAPLGAMTGLITAILLGGVMYFGGVRLPLAAFFRWSALLILFVAAGLAAGAIRAFHEAGIWNHYQNIAYHFGAILSTHSVTGTLLQGLFGYQEAPTVSEVFVYGLYLIPALAWFSLNMRRTRTETSTPSD